MISRWRVSSQAHTSDTTLIQKHETVHAWHMENIAPQQDVVVHTTRRQLQGTFQAIGAFRLLQLQLYQLLCLGCI